jgi:hypothetical protein
MSKYEELSTFLSQNDLQEKAVREKFSDLIRRIGKKDLIDTDAFYLELSKRIKPAKRPRKKIWELSNAGLIRHHYGKAEKRLKRIKEEIKRTPAAQHNKLVKLRASELEIDYAIDRMGIRLEEIKQQNIEKLREFGVEDTPKTNSK